MLLPVIPLQRMYTQCECTVSLECDKHKLYLEKSLSNFVKCITIELVLFYLAVTGQC